MKKYILYGAASIGDIAKSALEKCGVEIVGYIDRRAFELSSYNNLPVWDLEEIPEIFVNDNFIVYVSVKNVFEHEEIVRKLVERGFRYIIYKPYNVLLGIGTEEEIQIAEWYDSLFSGIYLENAELPICRHGHNDEMHDFAVIEDKGETVVANIPLEFIFTNNYDKTQMQKWGNISIPSFFTHIKFFRGLNGDICSDEKAYLKEYCEFTAELQKKIAITDAWKRNVIRNRTQIYEQMEEALELDSGFFVRNAPEAVWNDKRKIFNLTSGKHRCTFLAAKGKKYISLKISKADYERFVNINEVYHTKELLLQFSEKVEIPHPYFYRGFHSSDGGTNIFLQWFSRTVAEDLYYAKGKVSFEQVTILDYVDDQGHFSRYMKRVGSFVYRSVVPNQLEKQLNNLFAISLTYCKEYKKGADIVLGDQTSVEKVLRYKGKCRYIIFRNIDARQYEKIRKNGLDPVIINKVNSLTGETIVNCYLFDGAIVWKN